MKKTCNLIGICLLLWGSVLQAASTDTVTQVKPTFFGKVFSFANITPVTKQNEIPPIMNNNIDKDNTVVKEAVDNNVTATTTFKSFKVKEGASVDSAGIRFGFVDGSNVVHQLEIPPIMVKGVVLDSNNAVRYIEVEPNAVKAGAVEGGSINEIPPIMGIEGDQH